MAIQLPRISNDIPMQPEQSPKLEQANIDVSTPMARQSAALDNAAENVVKLQTEIRHQEADNTATNKANEYQIWRQKRLYGDPDSGWQGYANIRGRDPKELYAEFDKEEKKKLSELSTAPQNQEWSPETQNLVNRRLSRHYVESELQTLTQYSHQKRKYDDELTDTRVTLAQHALFNSSAAIDPEDPETFKHIEANIADMRNARISQGLGDMSAIRDENGEFIYNDGVKKETIKMSQMLKLKIAEDISKGLTAATKNLVDSHEIEKAKALKKWADENGYLDTAGLGKLEDRIEKGEFKERAAALANEAYRKNDASLLDNIKDPRLRLEAKRNYNSEKNIDAQDQKRQAKENYNAAFDYVNSVMRSKNPFADIVQLERDPKYIKLSDNMTPEQKKAIQHMVEAPAKSNPQVKAAVVDFFFNGDVKGTEPNDFQLKIAGLDKADQRYFYNMYIKRRTMTDSEMDSQYKSLGKAFDEAAFSAGMLRKIPGSQNWTTDDAIRAPILRQEFLKAVENEGKMSAPERAQFATQWVADKMADREFQRPERKKFNGGRVAPPTPSTTGSDQAPVDQKKQELIDSVRANWGSLNGYQRLDKLKKWRTEKGLPANYPAPPDEVLIQWEAEKLGRSK